MEQAGEKREHYRTTVGETFPLCVLVIWKRPAFSIIVFSPGSAPGRPAVSSRDELRPGQTRPPAGRELRGYRHLWRLRLPGLFVSQAGGERVSAQQRPKRCLQTILTRANLCSTNDRPKITRTYREASFPLLSANQRKRSRCVRLLQDSQG